MATMYEKLMCIPLFMGLSHQQISGVIEKTPITFSQYSKDEVICHRGDIVNKYSCLLDGEIEIKHQIGLNNELTIVETIDRPLMLNADRMFGINIKSEVEIQATKKTSIMEFSKEEFIKLLNSDNIIMLNYLNNLCLRSQISAMTLNSFPSFKLFDFIKQTLLSYTSRLSSQIDFQFKSSQLADYLNQSESEVNDAIAFLESENKLIPYINGFVITNRSLFI